ncbi:hypothetical protein BJX66DRAFT_291977 [Aspergillus keveii]|uniref:Uncharacterized protein n=1 Tax=Aspergillus keveii TaxID=714993 RepID=A0ABR4GLS4_9EURO
MLWHLYLTSLPRANPTNPAQFDSSQSKRADCGRVETKARMKRGVHTEWQEEKWKNEPGNKPSNGRRLFQDVVKGCGDVDHTAYVLLRFRQQRVSVGWSRLRLMSSYSGKSGPIRLSHGCDDLGSLLRLGGFGFRSSQFGPEPEIWKAEPWGRQGWGMSVEK